MSPALVLLQHLRTLGVAIEVDGDQLKIRGSKVALTEQLVGKIKANKSNLLSLLGTPTAPTSVSLCDALPPSTRTAAVVPSAPSVVPSVPLVSVRSFVRSVPSFFPSAKAQPAPPVGVRYTRLRTFKEDVADLAARISAAPAVALCVEGNKDHVLNRPWRIHLGFADGSVWVHDLVLVPDVGPIGAALCSSQVVMHDGVGDLARLAHYHAIRPASVKDTFLAAKILDGGREQNDEAFELDVLADRWLRIKVPSASAYRTVATGFPSEAWSAYARVLLPLADKLEGEFATANVAQTVRLEDELLPVVVEMMLAGVRVDRGVWDARLREAQSRVRTLEPRVKEQLGLTCLKFDHEVLAALQKMELPVTKTDRDTLAPYMHVPVVKDLIDLRRHTSFAKGIGTAMSKALGCSEDGRARVELRQLGAVTGRFTTRQLNLLGIPKDDEVRRAFVPADGYVFVLGDYVACQMRIAAAYTGEQNLLELFRRGGDPHTLTASLVLEKPESEVTKPERDRAKAVNFGFLFGMGVDTFIAYALSNYRIVFTREEAAAFRAKFLEAYPAIARWHASTAQSTSEVLASAGGRVRYFPGDDFCARLASPVQSTEADGIKRAMIRLAPGLAAHGARLLLCIHDELVIETPKAAADAVKVLVEREMRESMQELVPEVVIKVDVGVRTSWAKADDISALPGTPDDDT